MSLIYAGIDEAAYGPLLGPLCIGLSVFRIHGWEIGAPAPNLWSLLSRGVCQDAGDKRSRIPIADSKRLKLANSVRTHHPLVHLERAVIAGLRLLGHELADDRALHSALGATLDDRPWYSGPPLPIPVGRGADAVGIDANSLARAMEAGGVELLDLRCCIVGEDTFNEAVRTTGSKAAATVLGLGQHLRSVRDRWCSSSDHVRIVCDRLGGRTAYSRLLECECPGTSAQVLEEGQSRSRYQLSTGDPAPGPADTVVQFQVEAESAHLPVALASMIAKYVRELAMARFNRYWCALDPALKPTAGYSTDARRWLTDAAPVLTRETREAIVRIA